jgi:urease accessory protein
MKTNRWAKLTGLLLMLSSPVHAHTGVGAVHGLADGLLHPLLGIDHLLVMLAIGLWAAVRGGTALWLLPISFVSMMAAGAGLHFTGVALTSPETWVAVSVLASGVLVWRNVRLSSGLAVALVAVFALGHGYVHAAELADGADARAYALGFLLMTATLHVLGVAVGVLGAGRLTIIRSAFGLLCTVVGATLLAGI